MTLGLITSKNQKNKLIKKAHLTKLPADVAMYKKYANIYYKLIRKSKINHVNEKLELYKNNPKQLWKTINTHTNRKMKDTDLPETINFPNGTSANNNELKSNGFNNFFANVGPNLAKKFKNTNNYTLYLPEHNYIKTKFRKITVKELDKIISSIKPKTSFGHDGISNKIFKEIYPVILPHLLHIINLSLTTGIVPNEWKLAKIIPIFKKGDKEKRQ